MYDKGDVVFWTFRYVWFKFLMWSFKDLTIWFFSDHSWIHMELSCTDLDFRFFTTVINITPCFLIIGSVYFCKCCRNTYVICSSYDMITPFYFLYFPLNCFFVFIGYLYVYTSWRNYFWGDMWWTLHFLHLL